jgi:hypothetical protein
MGEYLELVEQTIKESEQKSEDFVNTHANHHQALMDAGYVPGKRQKGKENERVYKHPSGNKILGLHKGGKAYFLTRIPHDRGYESHGVDSIGVKNAITHNNKRG